MTAPRGPDRTVLLRGWPGMNGWRASTGSPSAVYPSLARRPSTLYLFAAARAGTMPETFGLGAAVVARGASILCGALIVPADADAGAVDELRAWGSAHPLETVAGPYPWEVVTVSAFFDPTTTVERSPWAFVPTAYSGAGWTIGADLGRTFGLAAEHVVARTGKHRDGWALWLPGWGRRHDDGAVKRRSPHRPCLYLSGRRVGWQVEFGPCLKGCGKRTEGRAWRGAFLDVLSLAYALDADRGASFLEHCGAFRIDAAALPLAVTLDADGAERVTMALDTIRRLATALDAEAGRVLASSQDRQEGVRRFDLARTVSPGALAGHVLRRFGVRPPLETMSLSDDEHRRWAESFHGGWCDLDRRLAGVPFPAVAADVRSCYPLVAHRLGWWEFLTADRVERHDVTARLRALCRRAAEDPTVSCDPDVWDAFGVTLAEVEADGERFCVSVDDPLRPDGRTEVVPVRTEGRTLHYSWPDVVMAAILEGRAPRIVRAVHYVPVGRQESMRRRVPLVGATTLDSEEDPAVAIVLRRMRAKARGDQRSAALLRVVANSLVYGVTSRFDDVWRRTGRNRHGADWTRTERPGPWSCLPVASSVAAGARFLLAVLDRMVADAGGTVAYRDTDSSLIPASPTGGPFTLPGGSTVGMLAWAEVDAVLAAFAPLAPAEEWPVWVAERGSEARPLRAVIFAPKRHAQWADGAVTWGEDRDTDENGLDDLTEAMLGANYIDPPAMTGRGRSGLRHWSEGAVAREVERAVAGDAWTWRPVPWEGADDLAFPALRRFSVRTPAMARALPQALGARPGTRYLVADRLWRDETAVPVVLEAGDDLSDWQALGWLNKPSGAPLWPSTDPADTDAVQLASLADKARDWSRPSRLVPVEAVTVTPTNVGYRGRVSPVVDANGAGMPGDLADYRPDYGTACPVDDRPVERGRIYCSDRCRGTARARRARQRRAIAQLPTCALEECSAPARPRSVTCSERHRKALARRSAPVLPPDAVVCPGCSAELLGVAATRGTCRPCHEKGVAA